MVSTLYLWSIQILSSPQKPLGRWRWNIAEMFITLAFTKLCFLLPLLMCFRCYGNLKFLLTYNGKSESRPLFLYHCRYFDKSFRDVPWVVLYQTYEFCPYHGIWLVAMATKRINSRKNHLLRSHKGDEADTSAEMFITLASTKTMFFIAIAHVLSLLWHLKVSIDL